MSFAFVTNLLSDLRQGTLLSSPSSPSRVGGEGSQDVSWTEPSQPQASFQPLPLPGPASCPQVLLPVWNVFWTVTNAYCLSGWRMEDGEVCEPLPFAWSECRLQYIRLGLHLLLHSHLPLTQPTTGMKILEGCQQERWTSDWKHSPSLSCRIIMHILELCIISYLFH